jgi:hypothetical protein
MYYQVDSPLYETDGGVMVGIWDKRIKDASKAKEPFTAISTWRGYRVSVTHTPEWIKKNCELIEKVYKRPNEPMKEYKIFIPKPLTEAEKLIKFYKECG